MEDDRPALDTAAAARSGLTIGPWHVDPRADEIAADGRTLRLEPLKMRLLMALASRPGEVVLTQELLDEVWPGVVVAQTSVYQGIAQLRKTLGDDPARPAFIETVPRKGYRLIAPVRREPVPVLLPVLLPVPMPAPLPTPVPSAEGGAGTDAGIAARIAPAADHAPPAPAGPLVPGMRRRAWLGGAAATAALAGAGLWRWRLSAPVGPLRLAVLPFADASRGQMEQPLSTSLSLDVTSELQAYPDLEVIAYHSVQALGDGERDLAQVARRLTVTHAVRGRVERLGERVRVDTELLAVPRGAVQKTAVYETTMERLSVLPRDIAAELAGALGVRPAREPPPLVPSAAYELYTLGVYALRQRGAAAVLQARDYFQRGIELDPRYPRNHVGLGWTWVAQAETGFGIGWEEGLARARPAFDRAYALAPNDATVLAAQATVLFKQERFDEARQRIRAAVAADPGYAQAHFTAGAIEVEDAWPLRAVAPLQVVARLDPLNAGPHWKLASALAFAGQPDAARDACRRGLALEPNSAWCHWLLGTVEFGVGHLGAAIDAYRQTLKIEPKRLYTWNQLGWTQLDLGLPDAAEVSFRAAAALLPDRLWLQLDAAAGWLLRDPAAPPPAALGLDPSQLAEATDVITLLTLRALAGLPPNPGALDAAIARLRSAGTPLHDSGWAIYHGRNRLADIAMLYAAAGQAQRAAVWIDEAQQQLDRFAQRGNRGFGLRLSQATLLALRGDDAGALQALEAAVDTGWRRGWRLRRDPAFAGLRQQARFAALVARIDALSARERAHLPG